ncbi:hypothetical protein Hanom_Chr00s000005g01612401 [Helianthus anomalus]
MLPNIMSFNSDGRVKTYIEPINSHFVMCKWANSHSMRVMVTSVPNFPHIWIIPSTLFSPFISLSSP